MEWLKNNIGSIIILLVLAAIVIFIIVYRIRCKKKNKSSCCGDCSKCGLYCPPQDSEDEKK